MPVLINAANPIEAWKSVVQFIANNGDTFNVIVNIVNPLDFTDADLALYEPCRNFSRAMRVHDVANTIFPKRSSFWNVSNEEFTEYYGRAYHRLLERGPKSWGMYFLRLTAFGNSQINQLDRILRGLSSWGRNHKATFVVHFSSSDTDSPRPLGAPCLQFCEFLRKDNALSLLAVYRSHDYFLKSLGNFVGLSRLLHYVAHKTGLSVGSIICHSTYAYLAANRRRAIALAEGDM